MNQPRNDSRARPARAVALPPAIRTLPALLLLAALALLLIVPSARGAVSKVVWASATHPDQFRFTATAGKELKFTLTASSSTSASVLIEPVQGLPTGASIGTSSDGDLAKATFRWRPTEPGDYSIGFVAKAGAGATAPVRTYRIRVNPSYPYRYELTDDKIAHWAPVLKRAIVRVAPKPNARAVTRLQLKTEDADTRNILLVLEGLDRTKKDSWYRVRLPILPNNSTGWVQRSALGHLFQVNTHLYIDRTKLTATLKRDGVTVFTTRIGVGKSHTPTPRGEFYVRNKLTNFNVPFYGPIVFGTSAKSASNAPEMVGWPGGGFVGVHGTSLPELIPGRPSHGCIRMHNEAILRLAKLMQVGSPVTIR
jgi:hypothetical protein